MSEARKDPMGPDSDRDIVAVPAGFLHLRGHLSAAAQIGLMEALGSVVAEAPYFTPAMPKSGKPLSVKMTNCGSLGWVTDQASGYRYQAIHPTTGRAWPAIPDDLMHLWQRLLPAAPLPQACLVNFYSGKARLGSHRDADEEDQETPVLSVSLGDAAVFHVGGLARSDAKVRMTLQSGDVVILGGTSRRAYHGIDRVLPGTSDLLPGGGRLNLTLRRVTR